MDAHNLPEKKRKIEINYGCVIAICKWNFECKSVEYIVC